MKMITTAKISFLAISVGVSQAKRINFQLTQLVSNLEAEQGDWYPASEAAMVLGPDAI